jgi:hypothetical protein
VTDEAEWDDGDKKLVTDVIDVGWHLVAVHAAPGQAAWVFSVGLWHTYRRPEISMFGLQTADMGIWINKVGDDIKAGKPPQPEESRVGVIDGFAVQWRPAHQSWYRDLFGYGLWFYQGWFPMLQMIWPDRHGRWPWDEACGERCKQDQPVLWMPAEQHPLGKWRYGDTGLKWLWPDRPDRRVFVTNRVARDESPVVYVVHDSDGDWQFLDGGSTNADDVAVAHLGEVVARHPHVNQFHDLRPGWHAWTKPPDPLWHRAPMRE